MRDTDVIAVAPNPDSISIVVAGGPGAFIGLHTPNFGSRAIRKVNLPSGWDKLVAKYKDVDPIYARY
jgi:hypothetical protein